MKKFLIGVLIVIAILSLTECTGTVNVTVSNENTEATQ